MAKRARRKNVYTTGANRRSRKNRPATTAERAALKFNPVKVQFAWTNDEWTRTHLTRIRIAAVLLNNDRKGLRKIYGGLNAVGEAGTMVEGIASTLSHLRAMVETLDCALTRSFLVLDELGFGPENPPDNVVLFRSAS